MLWLIPKSVYKNAFHCKAVAADVQPTIILPRYAVYKYIKEKISRFTKWYIRSKLFETFPFWGVHFIRFDGIFVLNTNAYYLDNIKKKIKINVVSILNLIFLFRFFVVF